MSGVTRAGILRLLHITAIASRHAVAHGLMMAVLRVPLFRRRLRSQPLTGPVRFRITLEELGGSFIKLGQMLALQPDILSLEYCNALFTLLDRVTPFPYADVERTFVEEFGRPPDEVFDTFDHRPLATASVGQVHVATLGGRKLAVKVRRPNVELDFGGDIRLITAMTTMIRRLRVTRLFWLLEPLEEFVAWTYEELDYRIEARYMERLRRNAEDRPAERIPAVLRDLTTKRTLVAEFLDGHTLLACLRARDGSGGADALRIASADIDSHAVARNIINNFLGAVFRHGMFHADLHPANLLVLRANAIGYIDFGITGVISAHSRRNLVALTLAYTSGNVEGMADSFFNVCRVTNDSSPRGFRRGLANLAPSWYERSGNSCHLRKNFTLVMLDMLKLSRQCGVWPDRDVIKYIRSAIAIDGLITRMAPGFDISEYLASVCSEHLRWHMRGSLFTYDMMSDIVAASGRLMRDGLTRTSAAVSRAADTSLAAGIHLRLERSDSTPRDCLDVLALGAVALGAAAIGSQASDATFSAQLFTVAVVFVALASFKIARTLRGVSSVARFSGQ